MLSFINKSTKGIVLILAVFIAILFTSLVFRSFDRVPWYRQIFMTVMEPPTKLATGIEEFFGGIWGRYIALSDAAKQNEQLKNQISGIERQLSDSIELEKENARLRALLSMASSLKREGLGARVISSSPMGEFKTVTIDRGSNDSLKKNQVVISGSGLVGKIVQLGKNESVVQLISDPNSAVDVIAQRSGARALLVGEARKLNLRPFFSLSRVEYLKKGSDVIEGDVIVTSGLDRLYPSGIPVGTLQNLKLDPSGIFVGAEVVPYVDYGQMREVYILK